MPSHVTRERHKILASLAACSLITEFLLGNCIWDKQTCLLRKPSLRKSPSTYDLCAKDFLCTSLRFSKYAMSTLLVHFSVCWNLTIAVSSLVINSCHKTWPPLESCLAKNPQSSCNILTILWWKWKSTCASTTIFCVFNRAATELNETFQLCSELAHTNSKKTFENVFSCIEIQLPIFDVP